MRITSALGKPVHGVLQGFLCFCLGQVLLRSENFLSLEMKNMYADSLLQDLLPVTDGIKAGRASYR